MIFINSPSSGCPTTTVRLLVFDLQTDINDQQYVKQWNKMLEFPEHEVFTNRNNDMLNTNENVKLLNKIPPFFVGCINRWTTSLGRFKPVFATFACNHIYVYIIYIRTFLGTAIHEYVRVDSIRKASFLLENISYEGKGISHKSKRTCEAHGQNKLKNWWLWV